MAKAIHAAFPWVRLFVAILCGITLIGIITLLILGKVVPSELWITLTSALGFFLGGVREKSTEVSPVG